MTEEQDAFFAKRLKEHHVDRKALACSREKPKQYVRDMDGARRALERMLGWHLRDEDGRGTVPIPSSFESSSYLDADEVKKHLTRSSGCKTAWVSGRGSLIRSYLGQVISEAGSTRKKFVTLVYDSQGQHDHQTTP